MRFVIISIIIFLGLSTNAQSYFKHFPIASEKGYTVFGMKVDSTAIFLSSKNACYTDLDSITCLLVSKHDYDGTVIWSREFPWTDSANERCLSFIGDTLICNSHVTPEESNNVFNLLFLDRITGDSIWHRQWQYESGEGYGTYSNGHVRIDDDIYMYGQTGTHTIQGLVQHYRMSDGYEATYVYGSPIGETIAGWDMVVNQDNQLAVLNEIREDDEYREVLVMSREGEILDRIYGPNYGTHTNVSNQMILLNNGNYCFFHNIDHWVGDNTPQLISMRPDGSIDWTLDYPSRSTLDTIGNYSIGEMALCDNGDILVVGQYTRHTDDPNWGRDVFLMRVTQQGEQRWVRYYNKPKDDGTSDMRQYYFSKITELSDGSILAAGQELGVHRKPYFLRVDADGCHDEFPCQEEVILSTVDQDIVWESVKAIPNPVQDITHITLPRVSTGVWTLYDPLGRVVQQETYRNLYEISIDVSGYAAGNYWLTIIDDEHAYNARLSVIR